MNNQAPAGQVSRRRKPVVIKCALFVQLKQLKILKWMKANTFVVVYWNARHKPFLSQVFRRLGKVHRDT